MARRGRPPKADQTPFKGVSAQLPQPEHERFVATCEALDITQAEVIRTVLRAFMAENASAYEEYVLSRERPNEPHIPGVARGGARTAA